MEGPHVHGIMAKQLEPFPHNIQPLLLLVQQLVLHVLDALIGQVLQTLAINKKKTGKGGGQANRPETTRQEIAAAL